MIAARLDPVFDPLVAWLRGRGGFVGAIGLAGEGPARGIVATAPIERGESLLRVPLSACIGEETARGTRVGAAVHAGWRGPAREAVTLAAALLELRAENRADYLPFLNTMPACLDGRPSALSTADLRASHGTAAGDLLGDIAARHDDEWAWLCRLAEAPRCAGVAEWSEARALVTSRQHFLHPYEGTALVPVADLFNHARQPDVDWHFDRDEGVFEVRARQSAVAGTPLNTHYGAKSNARLWVHYGFTLPDNPDDDVLLALPHFGVAGLGFPPWGGDVAAVRLALRIDGGTPAQRRRGWRRLARLLARQRAGLPPVSQQHPAALHLGRIVAGERAVIDTWLARCARGATTIVEPGAASARRSALRRPVPRGAYA